MSSSEQQSPEEAGAATPLDVRIAVDPPGECGCPPVDREPTAVSQSLSTDGDGAWTCGTVMESEEGDSEYEQVEGCDACPCYLLSTFECVVELTAIRDGRLHYSVTVPHRSMLAPVVERLRETGSDVSVYRILAAGDGEDDCPALTEKQRETLQLAIEYGYYDQPRGATLADIADELDITTSAASQRLTSAQRRLIERYVTERGPDGQC